MWITRKHYEDVQKELAEMRAVSRTLADQNIAQRNTIEWLCGHATRIERERAALIKNYMGVTVESPEFSVDTNRTAGKAKTDTKEPHIDVPMGFGLNNPFADVGDDMAKKLGLSWADDGSLNKS